MQWEEVRLASCSRRAYRRSSMRFSHNQAVRNAWAAAGSAAASAARSRPACKKSARSSSPTHRRANRVMRVSVVPCLQLSSIAEAAHTCAFRAPRACSAALVNDAHGSHCADSTPSAAVPAPAAAPAPDDRRRLLPDSCASLKAAATSSAVLPARHEDAMVKIDHFAARNE